MIGVVPPENKADDIERAPKTGNGTDAAMDGADARSVRSSRSRLTTTAFPVGKERIPRTLRTHMRRFTGGTMRAMTMIRRQTTGFLDAPAANT